MSEETIKGILQRIKGWKIEMKELSRETSNIKKRINQAEIQLDEILDD